MATAGRILIIPRGGYSSTTQYEPLDLVLYNGDSWLCKQNTKGIEPSDDNSAYWYRFTENGSDISSAIGSDLVLNGSYEGSLKINKTYGNSEQRKTTGKNLAKSHFTNGKNIGVIIDNLVSNTTYTFSFVGTKADAIYVRQGSLVEGADPSQGASLGYVYGTNSYTFTPTESGAYHIQLYYTNGAVEISKEQLEIGDSVTEYEPYTGGIASPNPEYPQPIVNVGQRLVSGKNLLNVDYESQTNNGITFDVNSDKTVTVDGVANGVAAFQMFTTLQAGKYVVSGCPSGSGCSIEHKTNDASGTLLATENGTGYVTFTITDQTRVCSYIRIPNGTTCNNLIFKPMIYLHGIEDTSFEPYTGGVEAVIDVPIETEVLSGNLFDKTEVLEGLVTTTGIVTDAHPDYYRSDYIPVKGSKITISGNSLGYVGGSVGMLGFDSNKNIVSSSNTVTMDISSCAYVMISVPKNNIDVLMLNYGTEALPYQPYTKQSLTINKEGGFAGIPVTDASLANYTDENGQMWCCDERDWDREIYVGNLFDANAVAGTNSSTTTIVESEGRVITVTGYKMWAQTNAFIVDVKQGEKYILSASSITGGNISRVSIQKGSDSSAFASLFPTNRAVIFEVPSGETSIKIVLVTNGTSTDLESDVTAVFTDVLLRPVEIDGIPTSAKYVPYSGGVFKKMRGVDVQRIARKRLLSNISWGKGNNWTNPCAYNSMNFMQDSLFVDGYAVEANLMCNHLLVDTPNRISSHAKNTIGQGGGYTIYISIDGVETVESLKSYLDTNEVYVDYILATPIYHHIPEEEAAQHKELQANDSTTTIFSDAAHEAEYPASKDGAMLISADMTSKSNEVRIESLEAEVTILKDKVTTLEDKVTALETAMKNVLTKADFTDNGATLTLNWL